MGLTSVEFTTVVIASAGEPATWVRAQCLERVEAGLFAPFVWITEPVDSDDPTAEFLSPQGVLADRLIAMVAQRPSARTAFRIVRLVLPGAKGPAVEGFTHRIVELYPQDDFRLVNLLVPAEDREVRDSNGDVRYGAPTIDLAQPGQQWLTVIASPEDLSPAGPLPVELDEKLVAHATGALGVVGALWIAQNNEGPFDDKLPPGAGNDESGYIFHCSSRSLLVDGAVGMAVTRALHVDEHTGRTVVAGGAPLPCCDGIAADERVAQAADELIGVTAEFQFVARERQGLAERSYLGLRPLVRMIAEFLFTKLPRFIVRDLRNLMWRLGASLSSRVHRRLFDAQSKHVFSVVQQGTVLDEEQSQIPVGVSIAEWAGRKIALPRERFATVPMATTWNHTRRVALSLLDGADLHPPLSDELSKANKASIIADQTKVFGPLITPDLIDDDLRLTHPNLTNSLQSGDIRGLEGVLAQLSELVAVDANGGDVDDPGGPATSPDGNATVRGRSRRLIAVFVWSIGVLAVLLWVTPLPAPWNAVATAAAGVSAGACLLGMLPGLLRPLVAAMRRRRRARQPSDAVPPAHSDAEGPGELEGEVAKGEASEPGEVPADGQPVDRANAEDEPVLPGGEVTSSAEESSGAETLSVDVDMAVAERERNAAEAQLAVLQATLDRLERSFVGRLARQIHGAHLEAERHLDTCFQRLVELEGPMRHLTGSGDPDAPDQRPSAVRRMLRALRRNTWRVLRVVLIIIAVLLLLLTPLAPIVAGLIVVGAVVTTAAKTFGYVRRCWLDWVRGKDAEPEERWLLDSIDSAIKQSAQLERTYELLVDWTRILQIVATSPFGPPAASEERRAGISLPPLNGHQVAHGLVDEVTVVRMCSRLQKTEMQPGWLGRVFDALVQDSIDDYSDRYDVDPTSEIADPFADQNTPATQRHRSPRRALHRHIADPSSRFALRSRRIRVASASLARQGPDELARGLQGVGKGQGLADDFLRGGIACLQRPLLRTTFQDRRTEQGEVNGAIDRVIIWRNRPLRSARSERPDVLEEEDEAIRIALNNIKSEEVIVHPPRLDRASDGGVPSDADDDDLLFQVVGIGISRLSKFANIALLASAEPAKVDVSALQPTAAAVGQPTVLTADALEQRRKRVVLPLDGFPVGSIIAAGGIVAVPPRHDSYAFMFANEVGPYRVPLNEPIEFVIRETGGPPDAVSLVRDCLQQIADVSGLTFRFGGLTDAFPGFGADRAASRLWIGWVFPEDDLSGSYSRDDVAGRGGAGYRLGDNGVPVLIPLLATVRAELDLQPGYGATGVGSVLLHELCHALNLDHVGDPGQIMYPMTTDQIGLGAGDRYGLWLLGEGRHQW